MSNLDFAAIIASGFLATLGMTLAGYLLGAGGLTYFDLDILLVNWFDATRSAPGVGVVVHFLIGISLAAAYILLWQPAQGINLLTGVLCGAVLWLVAMVLILPLAGKGIFAARYGWRAPLALLASHLVYGVMVAILYPLLSTATSS